MKVDLSEDEIMLVMKHRREQHDKNRPERHYNKDCKNLSYDADGDFCKISKGCGVNSHCWAKREKECPYFEDNCVGGVEC